VAEFSRTGPSWAPPRESLLSSLKSAYERYAHRLFLKALFLSDIVNGSGTEILPAAWNGERIICPQRSENWPNQSRPPPSAWAIWKLYLRKRFLGRGLRLRSPMGPWVNSIRIGHGIFAQRHLQFSIKIEDYGHVTRQFNYIQRDRRSLWKG
jgi:hypothetical protein